MTDKISVLVVGENYESWLLLINIPTQKFKFTYSSTPKLDMQCHWGDQLVGWNNQTVLQCFCNFKHYTSTHHNTTHSTDTWTKQHGVR